MNPYSFVYNAPYGWYDFLGREPRRALRLSFDTDSSARKDMKAYMKRALQDLEQLNDSLKKCCKEYKIGCDIDVFGSSRVDQPAPKDPPKGGYPRDEHFADYAGQIEKDGTIPVTYTDSDQGGGIVGAAGLGLPGAGVILSIGGGGYTVNALTHELGHVGGFDGGTVDKFNGIEGYLTHYPDPSGTGIHNYDDVWVMARHGGGKVDQCLCEKLSGLAK